jgi:hypothetical protein
MMKQFAGIMIVAGTLAAAGFAGVQGPEVLNIDQKLSIDADDITLGRLFQLWDQATGMRSTVPSELANRRLSVHFAGLSVNDALQKIFDGQALGYVVVEGRGVVVTAPDQSGSTFEPPPAPSDEEIPVFTEQPGPPGTVRMKPEIEPPPPKLIPTPFGPIVNPNGSLAPPFTQLPPVDAAPPPPFFRPPAPLIPPAGAPNGPAQNRLFGPLPIYQNPPLMDPNQR